MTGEAAEWVQAEARARITGIRYCLTLHQSGDDGSARITDCEVRDLYATGPEMESPAPDEVVRRLSHTIDLYESAGRFSGVVLIAQLVEDGDLSLIPAASCPPGPIESILILMSKRLQIVMDDAELERLRRCAEREGLTLSDWARRAFEQARRRQTGPTPEQKLAALDRALTCRHPTGDIEEMLAEIERGRDLR